MFQKMIINLCLLFFTTFLKAQAFWWQPTTTETPAINVKHIPLTYFRTYTYQPLTGGPFTFPFSFGGGGGAAQTPLLNGGRYEQYTYPAAQQFQSAALGQPQRPLAYSQPTTTTTTSTPAPTTPTTTTTTTTTTTPKPTTTTSTTTTTTTTNMPPKNIEPIINSGGGIFGPMPPQYVSSMYPNYNRRLFMSNLNGGSNYYRPHYPYPDYATISKPTNILQQQSLPTHQRPSHVQFVPCMCPVSVGVPSGLPIVGNNNVGNINVADPSNNLYMPQARSNVGDDVDVDDDAVDIDDDDSDMELPLDDATDGVVADKQTLIDLSQSAIRQKNDEALLSDDIQSIETNKIDNAYRKSKELLVSSTLSP